MPFRQRNDGGDLSAIFVHAGAGFHSHQNEKFHLNAVNDAAKTAMTILKNGGKATDAVEMAVRVLEDREITNAGYGSNLTMEGVVECDATMVDHYGRSGAAGAVSQVKNPISLARIVLQESTKELTLQRVPPNLLVGPGATEFAADNGLPVLPHDFLISNGARDRWTRWRKDLRAANQAADQKEEERRSSKRKSSTQLETAEVPRGSFTSSSVPKTPDSERDSISTLSELPTLTRPLVASTADLKQASLDAQLMAPMSITSPLPMLTRSSPDVRYHEDLDPDMGGSQEWMSSAPKRTKINAPFDGSDFQEDALEIYRLKKPPPARGHSDRDDIITDTVGAIAIDNFGNIAAGSSSGGIGMKHKGRCGPAALVGIGTAVVPIDPLDLNRVCVATVTSGTGEHMATTTAAATAADRVYSSMRKNAGKLENCSDDEALKSVVDNDFMRHPGVQNSHCAGAIGILAVKKTKDGIYFHFAHNTDSFAIASMHSEERKPVCVMSRNQGNATTAMGGRASRSKYARRR